jgi:hypothetical protein
VLEPLSPWIWALGEALMSLVKKLALGYEVGFEDIGRDLFEYQPMLREIGEKSSTSGQRALHGFALIALLSQVMFKPV